MLPAVLLNPVLCAIVAGEASVPARVVGREELLEAMKHSQGYDLTATANGPRLQAEVVLGLVPAAGGAGALGRPSFYSYDDTRASPNLRVTQKRLIRYRLLDYGDRIWYAEVEGLHGRPTSGVLGALFGLIGEARVLESRSAFAVDGGPG